MLRRTLLVLVSGLLIARPLVLGEDPGMLEPFDTSANMLLTALWFAAAFFWAVWRLWSRRGDWYGGAVEAGLFALVLLTFFGAEFAASYKHPARLIAWEWLGLFAAFCLVRQLAVSPDEQRGFFAVLLAGAVPLAVYAFWQGAVELPALRQQYGTNPESLQLALAQRAAGGAQDAAYLEMFRQRIQDAHVFGTFAHPNTFAGYLVLVIPGLVGAALLCARHRHAPWQVFLVATAATLGVVALWLTHSRGAMLALLLAGLGAVALVRRRVLLARRNVTLAVAAAAVLLIVLLFTRPGDFLLGKNESTAAHRLEYWRATARMVADHPWLGVGPGNFGRFYLRYMAETAGEHVKDPHNFLLEIWATCGVFALLALAAALGFFFVRVLKVLLRDGTFDAPGDLPPPAPEAERPLLPVRWEFYVGGMFGLLIAYIVRAANSSQDEIISETIKAAVGSVLWFAAFGLLEQIIWSDRARLLALTTGVVAVLLNLCVSGGINFPSLTCLLVAALALALNAAGLTPHAWVSRFRPLLYVPAPVLGGVALLYLLTVFYPISNSVAAEKEALAYQRNLQPSAKDPKPLTAMRAFSTAEKKIINPLKEVQKRDDPDNSRLLVDLADFYGELWFYGQFLRDRTDEDSKQLAQKAVAWAREAQRVDPDGRDGYLAEYRMYHQAARWLEWTKAPTAALGLPYRLLLLRMGRTDPDRERSAAARKEQYLLAAAALERYIAKEPNNAHLQYQLADALFRAGEPEKARPFAERAVSLDRRAVHPMRKLTNEQNKQLARWLEESDER